MDVVRHDDEAEFINYFPKWASLASSVRQDFENFINHLEGTLLSFSHLSQRDFAGMFVFIIIYGIFIDC